MKTNPDDPNFTAYALGELSPEECAEIEKVLADSPEMRAEVEQTRELAAELRDEFHAELRAAKPRNIIPRLVEGSFWSDARWSSLAVAAAVAILAIAGVVLLFENRTLSSRVAALLREGHARKPAEVQIEMETESEEQGFPAPDRISRDVAGENAFVSTSSNPVLTFAINFGTASYSAVRRSLESGALPREDAVRVEEMINYFRYDYSAPDNEPFSIDLEVAACPWQPEHRLLRIGVRRQDAADNSARIENTSVEFNPTQVASYRLIGYDALTTPRNEKRDGANSAGRASNQTATILVEIVPTVSQPSTSADSEMVKVAISYKKSKAPSWGEIARALNDKGAAFEMASPDFRFAAAVAEFGMLLRQSSSADSETFAEVLEWANGARGADADGSRAEFIRMARRAQSLTNG